MTRTRVTDSRTEDQSRAGRLGRDRQRDPHGESAARRICRLKAGAHRLSETLSDREPEPDAGAAAVAQPLKWLEDTRFQLVRNSAPVIDNFEHDGRTDLPGAHHRRPASR